MNRADLFSVPVFWGDIDPQKIIFKKFEVRYKFFSNTKTLRGTITPEAERYLLETLDKILTPHVGPMKITVNDVWENIYSKGDFEDAHIHPGSQMSFVIYKKGMTNTVLYAPYRYLNEHSVRSTPVSRLYPWYVIPPMKVGQILIFPSFIEHMVKKAEVDSGTISGDLMIKEVKHEPS